MSQSMDNKAMLMRFCYLGTFEPVHVQEMGKLNVTELLPELTRLCCDISDDEILLMLRQLLFNAELPRHDETLLVYAVYLSCDLKEMRWRTVVRKVFPVLIRDDKDFFLFVKYATLVQKALRRNTFFTRTVRKAICAWYEAQSLPALVQMWTTRLKCYGFSHCTILRFCRIPDSKFNNDAMNMIQYFFETYRTVVEAGDETGVVSTNVTTSSNAPPEASQTLLQQQAVEPAQQNNALAMNLILPLAKLHMTKNPYQAMSLIKRHNLSYDQLPKRLLQYDKIVATVIPTMTSMQLLKSWRFIAQRHLKNWHVYNECRKVFKDQKMLRECNLHPVVFLLHEYRFHRHSQAEMRKAMKRLDIPRLDYNFMRQLYFCSFGVNKSVGLRMHITLNMEETYKRKRLFGTTKHMRYHEAMIGLAFGYFMSEKTVSINYWHSNKNNPMTLKQLEWTKNMSILEAHKRVIAKLVKKSGQNLIAPIVNALKNENQVFDLFLVIVPTAGRSNPHNRSDDLFAHLEKYRTTRNPRAKFVIVSLRRHRRSMTYAQKRQENLLELCGLNFSTPKLISEFALERFN